MCGGGSQLGAIGSGREQLDHAGLGFYVNTARGGNEGKLKRKTCVGTWFEASSSFGFPRGSREETGRGQDGSPPLAARCGGGEAELSLRHVGRATPLTCQRRQHSALSCGPQGQSPAPLGQKSQGKERTAGLCQAPARLGEDELRRRMTERSGGAQVDILDSQKGQAERRGV